MNRKQCEELLPAIKHFANDGDLWYYDGKEWGVQSELYLNHSDEVANIIEDKYFEARKAYALGEEIEWLSLQGWELTRCPAWETNVKYRPKPKEPIYEWQWLFKVNGSRYGITENFYSVMAVELEWIKFEPSKRLRNL